MRKGRSGRCSQQNGRMRAARLADAIYGTLTVGALLAVESARQETYPETVGAVVIALIIYWIGHSYAEFTAERLDESAPLTFNGFAEALGSGSAMLAGGILPLLVLLVCWAFGVGLTTAVTAGIWTDIAMLVLIEVAAAIRAKRSRLELLFHMILGVLLGLGIITMRIVLH